MAGFPRPTGRWIIAATAAAFLADAPAARAQARYGGPGQPIRTFDPPSLGLVRSAVSASPTVARLVDALAATDVIVVVELTSDRFGLAGDLHYQATAGNVRYLRIRVSGAVQPWDQIAILAHELQHATEVAGDLDVKDAAGLAALMRRIGKATGRDRFETEAAVAVTRRVRLEVLRGKPLRAVGTLANNRRK